MARGAGRAGRVIQRPALRYHGGKWMLGEWIIAHADGARDRTEVLWINEAAANQQSQRLIFRVSVTLW
jgi:hypothetical protein